MHLKKATQFGLSQIELEKFNNRGLEGYEKVRIVSKGGGQLFWLLTQNNQYFIA